MKNVKFEEKLRRNIVDTAMREDYAPTLGIVLQYNSETHQATVVTARPGSQQVGEAFHNVPCPQTNGVQTVAPEPGRPCWLGFPNGTKNSPVIISYFNPSYRENDYRTQNYAVNDTPRFMMEM